MAQRSAAIWLVSVTIFVLARKLRRFLVRAAPFYATTNIIVVGVGVGILLTVIVQVTLATDEMLFWMIHLFAIGSLLFVAFGRDALDWADKREQVMFVSICSYALLNTAIWLIGKL